MKNIKLRRALTPAILLLFFISCSTFQQVPADFYAVNYDTVKANKLDNGKMWTFDNPPVNYFDSVYNFRPTKEWLDNVRMSALKFANWCSASFVSADGLILTNHHCVDFITKRIEKKGENIKQNGFYAKTLSEERKVPGLFVDQLVLIKDVTPEVFELGLKETDPVKKLDLIKQDIRKLEKKYSEKTGLVCKIIPFYNGAKYSLYGYKRYNDVRMAFVQESRVGLYGGDPDNFTYPRYNPDFSLLRVYDNGKPLKVEHYFKWSLGGAKPGEPLFVVGNPAHTERIRTMAELKFLRDVSLRNRAFMANGMKKIFKEMIEKYPKQSGFFKAYFFMLANSAKGASGELKGLRDPYLWARKKAFEKEFWNKVRSNPALNAKYGKLWNAIERLQIEKEKIAPTVEALNADPRFLPSYIQIAKRLLRFAESVNADEDSLKEKIKKEVEDVYLTKTFEPYEKAKLRLFSDFLRMNVGATNELYVALFDSKKGDAAVQYALNNTILNNKEKTLNLMLKDVRAIESLQDPFLNFVKMANEVLPGYKKRLAEINETENVLNFELGQALLKVYGYSIPPDATFTLRISDGVMKSYRYNGTIAPEFTTFYGIYNRYYSHRKKFPWDLPKEWLNSPGKVKLSTPLDFITTCDIAGGNSGSPVINKNAQIVGVAFDGNIESLPGLYIYNGANNRAIAVASQGILETVGKIYSAKRLVEELKTGHIPKEFKQNK